MRPMLLGAAVALFLSGAAQAAGFDDPKALVTALYDPYTHGEQPADLPGFYTDGLKALFARHQQQASLDNGIGSTPKLVSAQTPEFDPFVDAKHYLLFGLTIGDAVVNGDHALVDVSYTNFDHPTVLTVSLVRGQDGWKVDDIASMGGDQHWLLSWLLAYDPLDAH